jgi:hypothetical protein
MKHFNETELKENLQWYLKIRLKEIEMDLIKNEKKLLSKKILPNIKVVLEKNTESLEYRKNFYQTQLNNIK